MKRIVLGTLAALASAGIVTTIGVSGQGRVDSPGVITAEGGVPALGHYKMPKMPWGEPNLQGTYNANDLQGIPMQRPDTAGTRYRLNDEEFKRRVAQRDQNVANDNSFDFTLERGEEFEARFGTVGGAVAGGLIGAAVGHPAAGAVIGGGLGLGAGALVGDQMQGQQNQSYRQDEQIRQNQNETNRQQNEIDRLRQQRGSEY
jgi:outer membrane lipoprotein SlyB